MPIQLTSQLLKFIDASPSMFHATDNIAKILEENGFQKLSARNSWQLKKGGKYYTTSNSSAIIAFSINTDNVADEGFRIIGAHTDVPGFRIKPNPILQNDTYVKLNTEVYGGPIINTWLDRPLSIAGRVSLKSDDILYPTTRLVDLKKPVLIIPNLAIHMNREVNNGIKLNTQKDTLPILTYLEETVDPKILLNAIAKELDVAPTDILDSDLYLYPVLNSTLVGIDESMISAPRLDDLAMSYSALHALLNATNNSGITVFAAFDNEEVGSTTKQGANSPFLHNILERICLALGGDKETFHRAIYQSFLLSADVAHLLHPNFTDKSDPTNKVLPGKGPAIKLSANCSYTTDSNSFSVFANLCETNNIPYQIFVNRSDLRGGSTIGPVSTSQVAIRAVDIGTPMLSMHSACELMTVKDFIHTTSAMQAFFSL
ncbi:MAG: M18 family aminopeptidase [Cellulosilyticaceae bacterium]